MADIIYHPIGVIRSPFTDPQGMPIQPSSAAGARGYILLDDSYAAGLKDLDGFSHAILLYHFHKAKEVRMKVVPFLDQHERGVFATRAPCRPNPIGLSVVRLFSIEGTRIEIENIDVLDGTPLLDIKPYVPEFDTPAVCRIGWIEQSRHRAVLQKADGRFTDDKIGQ
ncbi:tRNA (N6-threonylcarbamoyladenosine(37)-N6)-methyltransferase TrmO [candidate division KSB1 bacterium]|nr:tRNA (N6-threonylcarbamoyladenosine(37)-N6)-methyltransferase TrmO [candidate division KSB1 bacterium]